MRPRGTPCRGEYYTLQRLPTIYELYPVHTIHSISTVISLRALSLATVIRTTSLNSLTATLIENDILTYELGEIGLLLKMFPEDRNRDIYNTLKTFMDTMMV